MLETKSTIEDVGLQMHVEDSRIKINGQDDSGKLYVACEDVAPLSLEETVAKLTIAGEDMVAEVDLDSRDLDALADVIHHIQEAMNDV